MYYIANWKLHKTEDELKKWIDNFFSYFANSKGSNTRIYSRELHFSDTLEHKKSGKINIQNTHVIIAASTVLLPYLDRLIGAHKVDYADYHIDLASQDISKFGAGAHTGEVGGFQLKSLIKYSIIGHSERRAMGETNEDIILKAKQALENDIQPVLCFSNLSELRFVQQSDLDNSKCLFAYEPLSAIGTGNPASPEEVKKVFMETKLTAMIYGGSVNPESIQLYASLDFINGFLIGSASLNPQEFVDLIDRKSFYS